MRLIYGLVRLDGAPADATVLDAMAAALSSPGLRPRFARQVQGPAGLGVLDFGIDPVSGECPLPGGTDGVWLAADLRLDRQAQLAGLLNLPSTADPYRLVLRALGRWGEDLPDHVDGDFALAAWHPAQGQLTCARDIMGVRPLCYSYQPGRLFAFASLPRGLHASGVASSRPDLPALGRLLAEGYLRGGATGFEDIAWLPPGHSLILTPAGLRTHRAWCPDPRLVGSWRGSAEEAAATLRQLVEEAVECRLPASGRAGAHLSGGLDSSAVTVLAARLLRSKGQRLHCYSQLARPFSGLALRDEREFVDAVLAQEPDLVWSSYCLPPLHEEGTIDIDYPVAGPVLTPDEEVCAAASAAGVHLLLSGAGGDEGATYNGIGLYATALRSGRWQTLATELRARARREGKSLVRAAAGRLLVPFLPDWMLALLHRLRGLPSDYKRRMAVEFLAPCMASEAGRHPGHVANAGNRPNDRIWMLTESYLTGRGNRWSILGARHGVAFSFPLLDRRILDFTLSLPPERFLNGGCSRQPFRDAMAGILPEQIRWRDTKFVSFPDMPLQLAAARQELLKEVEALRTCSRVTAVLNPDAVAAALRAAPEGPEAEALALAFNTPKQSKHEHWPRFRRGMRALDAVVLARHLARGAAEY